MRRVLPVAVTGLGCICATGIDAASCISGLDAGGPVPAVPNWAFDGAQSPVFSCALPDFSGLPSFLSRTAALAFHAARQALGELFPLPAECARMGVCLGTSVGATLNFTESYTALRAGQAIPPEEVVRYFSSNPASALAALCGCTGPVQSVVNACSSGADAIGIAAGWIRDGLCDFALAGGADALSEMSYIGFCRLMIASSEACKPFDRDRTGLNLGEGAAILLLESETSRARRGIKPAGRVLGYGTAGDAHHLTAPHPQGRGLRAALRAALEQGGCDGPPAFINAHATGTVANDTAEGLVYRDLFPTVPVFAGKGATGHTLGAAGAVEAFFTLAHLARGLIPASSGFCTEDPAIGLSPTVETTPCVGNSALSVSLAFGGNNSALLLEGPE